MTQINSHSIHDIAGHVLYLMKEAKDVSSVSTQVNEPALEESIKISPGAITTKEVISNPLQTGIITEDTLAQTKFDTSRCDKLLDTLLKSNDISQSSKALLFFMELLNTPVSLKNPMQVKVSALHIIDYLISNKEKIQAVIPNMFNGDYPSTTPEMLLKLNTYLLQAKQVSFPDGINILKGLMGNKTIETREILTEMISLVSKDKLFADVIFNFDKRFKLSDVLLKSSQMIEHLNDLEQSIPENTKDKFETEAKKMNYLFRGGIAATGAFLERASILGLPKNKIFNITPGIILVKKLDEWMDRDFPPRKHNSSIIAGAYSPLYNVVVLNTDMIAINPHTTFPEEIGAHEAGTHAIEAWARTGLNDEERSKAAIERIKLDTSLTGKEIIGLEGFVQIPHFPSTEMKDEVLKFIFEIISGHGSSKIESKTCSYPILNEKYEQKKLSSDGLLDLVKIIESNKDFIDQFDITGSKDEALSRAVKNIQDLVEAQLFRYDFMVGKIFRSSPASPYISPQVMQNAGISREDIKLTEEGHKTASISCRDCIQNFEYIIRGNFMTSSGMQGYLGAGEETRAQQRQSEHGLRVIEELYKSRELLKKNSEAAPLFQDLDEAVIVKTENKLRIALNRSILRAEVNDLLIRGSQFPQKADLVKEYNKFKLLRTRFLELQDPIESELGSLLPKIKSRYGRLPETSIISSEMERIVKTSNRLDSARFEGKATSLEKELEDLVQNPDSLDEEKMLKVIKALDLLAGDDLPACIKRAQSRNILTEEVLTTMRGLDATHRGMQIKPRLNEEETKKVITLTELLQEQNAVIDEIKQIVDTHGIRILDPINRIADSAPGAKDLKDEYAILRAVLAELDESSRVDDELGSIREARKNETTGLIV